MLRVQLYYNWTIAIDTEEKSNLVTINMIGKPMVDGSSGISAVVTVYPEMKTIVDIDIIGEPEKYPHVFEALFFIWSEIDPSYSDHWYLVSQRVYDKVYNFDRWRALYARTLMPTKMLTGEYLFAYTADATRRGYITDIKFNKEDGYIYIDITCGLLHIIAVIKENVILVPFYDPTHFRIVHEMITLSMILRTFHDDTALQTMRNLGITEIPTHLYYYDQNDCSCLDDLIENKMPGLYSRLEKTNFVAIRTCMYKITL
mgnify:CR=1 FL=1